MRLSDPFQNVFPATTQIKVWMWTKKEKQKEIIEIKQKTKRDSNEIRLNNKI